MHRGRKVRRLKISDSDVSVQRSVRNGRVVASAIKSENRAVSHAAKSELLTRSPVGRPSRSTAGSAIRSTRPWLALLLCCRKPRARSGLKVRRGEAVAGLQPVDSTRRGSPALLRE